MSTETTYDGTELCVCGHERDEHSSGKGWCVVVGPALDTCIGFRPASKPPANAPSVHGDAQQQAQVMSATGEPVAGASGGLGPWLQAAIADKMQAEAALRRYGRHDPVCAGKLEHYGEVFDCECGFAALRTAAPAARPATVSAAAVRTLVAKWRAEADAEPPQGWMTGVASTYVYVADELEALLPASQHAGRPHVQCYCVRPGCGHSPESGDHLPLIGHDYVPPADCQHAEGAGDESWILKAARAERSITPHDPDYDWSKQGGQPW